jgi:UDP-N-acetylmuramoylalanine--D-glutamate ligase
VCPAGGLWKPAGKQTNQEEQEVFPLTIQEYFRTLQGKRVAVLGIGVSNTPLIRMLLGAGVAVTGCDVNPREKFGGLIEELEALGMEAKLGPDYLEGLDHDVIFRSPGIRPDVPALTACRERGGEVTSEMELFVKLCPCKLIAVTGSDGKTTTTTIISELLKAAGYTTYVGGNIGKPLLPELGQMKEGDMAVLELSSFQLMTMEKSPDIAVITNLAPNHLNWHLDMGEYVAAKENIFTHQTPAGRAVFNYDNDLTREEYTRAPGTAVYFSRQNPLEEGVVVENGVICVKKDGTSRPVLPVDEIRIPGVHNIENFQAAIAAVDGLVPDEVIRTFARTFGGVEHRIEFVREVEGVKYYNDSIASSPSRTLAGLRAFKQKVILIAGGHDKKIPYDHMGPDLLAHCKLLILTGGDILGSTVPKLCSAVVSQPGYEEEDLPILFRDDFKDAVLAARDMAQPGDIVLMSPASTSFDKFRNFMERGEYFKSIVNSL